MVSAWSFRLLAALSIGALTAHATPLVAPAAPLAKVAPVVNDSSKHNLPVKVHVKFPIVDGPEADPSVDIDAILADYAEREAAAKLAASTSPEAAELFGSEQRGNTVAPTILSASAIPGFTPYSYYATTAYCKPSTILTWSCGPNCQANPGFKVVAAGGDGALVQYWFVGYDPSLKAVIVSHQGTDSGKIIPVLTNANILLDPLDPSLFPGISSDITVHSGFANAHAGAAPAVLAAVKKAISTYGATTVVTVGHSLGAAISLLDAVYLPLNLPSSISFKSYLYGLPRVGNSAFANYVDSSASRAHVTHIANEKDIVPIVPGRFLGFAHPAGEIHIQAPGSWYTCPGQDNESKQCIVGAVSNIFVGDTDDHNGPYGSVTFGRATCPYN